MNKREENNYSNFFEGNKYYFTDKQRKLYFKSPHSGKYENIKDVDLETFNLLTNFYSYDEESIFHESKRLKKGFKSFIDYESFGWFKVDDILYWFGNKVKANFTGDLTNISEHFFTDGIDLFVNGEFYNFDKNTFTLLNRSYAKDSNQIFHSAELIKSADSKSFRVIKEDSGLPENLVKEFSFLKDDNNSSWACDKNNLYYLGKPHLKGIIDPLSTRVFHKFILLDKKNVYYFDKIVKGANPDSFQPIVDLRMRNGDKQYWFFTYFYKDKENIYYFYEHEKDESKDMIIRCSLDNYDKFSADIGRITKSFSSFNLEPKDIERIKNLAGISNQ